MFFVKYENIFFWLLLHYCYLLNPIFHMGKVNELYIRDLYVLPIYITHNIYYINACDGLKNLYSVKDNLCTLGIIALFLSPNLTLHIKVI